MTDNFTEIAYPVTILDSFSNYFGLSSSFVGVLFIVCISLSIGISSYILFRSRILSLFSLSLCILVGTFMGLIPLWIPCMVGIMIFSYIFFASGTSSSDEQTSNNIPYWQQYGQHLKEAYSAKFGGENNGFNQEVDLRIKVMENNGKGFTRMIADDWLKRMHRFTEAK